MRKLTAILSLMLSFSTIAFADLPRDLRGKPKEKKLIIHSCDLSIRNRITSMFDENLEETLRSAKCSVVSDINYSTITDQLSKRYEQPLIYSQETIDVLKGVDVGTSVVNGQEYWKTCDAEDGDCIEWSLGAFDRPVDNIFIITQDQQKAILNKLIKNSSRQNTNVYFFKHEVKVSNRNTEAIDTYYDLRSAGLFIK